MDNNIALRKSTWQTGIGWKGESSRAVDGNQDANYGKRSCTHTDMRTKPYWAVDLGKSSEVTGVSITNRADCCSKSTTIHLRHVSRIKWTTKSRPISAARTSKEVLKNLLQSTFSVLTYSVFIIAGRLQNYNVVVTDTRPAGDSPSYEASNICAFKKVTHSGTLDLECYKPISGRYVMIQLKDRQYLTLCEVKVYASKRKWNIQQDSFSAIYGKHSFRL